MPLTWETPANKLALDGPLISRPGISRNSDGGVEVRYFVRQGKGEDIKIFEQFAKVDMMRNCGGEKHGLGWSGPMTCKCKRRSTGIRQRPTLRGYSHLLEVMTYIHALAELHAITPHYLISVIRPPPPRLWPSLETPLQYFECLSRNSVDCGLSLIASLVADRWTWLDKRTKVLQTCFFEVRFPAILECGILRTRYRHIRPFVAR